MFFAWTTGWATNDFFPILFLTKVAISYVHESRSTKIRLPPFPVYAQTTKEPKGLLDGLCPSLFPFEGFPSQKVFGDRNQLNWVLGQRVLVILTFLWTRSNRNCEKHSNPDVHRQSRARQGLASHTPLWLNSQCEQLMATNGDYPCTDVLSSHPTNNPGDRKSLFCIVWPIPQIYIYIYNSPYGSSRTFWAGINAMIWKVKYVLRKYLDP